MRKTCRKNLKMKRQTKSNTSKNNQLLLIKKMKRWLSKLSTVSHGSSLAS